MYSIMMRLNHDSIKQNLKILPTVCRCYSQKISLSKSISTRVLSNPRNALNLEASKKYFSSLSSFRCKVCTYKERIVHKKKLHNLASKEGFKQSPLDVNTTVLNNVLLYKYEKPRLFTFLHLFAPFQCVFWMGITYYTSKLLPKREKSVYEYFKENWVWVIISGSGVLLGVGSMVLIWAYTARSIKYIVLKAGGKDVTFLTYRLWKGNVGTTVPLSHVSSKIPRKDMKNYLPIKLKDRSLFYILDSGGEFLNPKLYDYTVGIRRFFR